jgi:hypothetical protein
MYEGALYDPLDGRQIATVEGIEIVRPVDNTTNLAIDSILNHNSNATYDEAKSIWSQKVFCYTSTAPKQNQEEEEKNNKEILHTVRLRPQSPRKHVPMDQAVIVYETATTFISRQRRGGQNQRGRDHYESEELWVHSEFPSGRSLWGKADVLSTSSSQKKQSNGDANDVDFTVYTKVRSSKSPSYQPDLTLPSSSSRKNGNNNGVIISPKRSSLIQFGSSDGTMESKHKFGARETYSYRTTTLAPSNNQRRNNNNNNSDSDSGSRRSNPFLWLTTKLSSFVPFLTEPTSTSTILQYTRYGEGPPFYSPGRMCMLELTARPVSCKNDVSPILRKLISLPSGSGRAVVGFHWDDAEDNGNKNSDRPLTIQEAWGRGRTSSEEGEGAVGPSQLRLEYDPFLIDNVDGSNSGKRHQYLQTFVTRNKRRALTLWDKIQASTALEIK